MTTMADCFRDDNTDGYDADELAQLNTLFAEFCATEGVDPDDADKSHLDRIAERVLAAYDDIRRLGIEQVGIKGR